MFENVEVSLKKIREQRPLILNITNVVTMDFIANGLLSLGASPVMCKAKQELEDLIRLASIVVINIGTLDEYFIDFCHAVCTLANKMQKPIVLDPVGAGASRYRTDVCQVIMQNFQLAIVKGNASEVMALAGDRGLTRGVDASVESEQALMSAQFLVNKHNVCVAVSGKSDLIVYKNAVSRFTRGSMLMPQVVGTGCLLSAVAAAFHAVNPDVFQAVSSAVYFYGVCGELASLKANMPGSFKTAFLDALSLPPVRECYE